MAASRLSEISEPLTDIQQDQLCEAEATVERLFDQWVQVGEALTLIRDERLYREKYKSFEEYCEARWSFGYRRANQLIQGTEIAKRVESANGKHVSQNGHSESETAKMTTDRHARALKDLPADEQPEAFREAVKTAPKDKKTGKPKVTQKHIETVVTKRKAEIAPSPEVKPEPPPAEPIGPDPIPWRDYNAKLLDLIRQMEEARDAMLALAKTTGVAGEFCRWIVERDQRTFFNNSIAVYKGQLVTGWATKEQQAKLPGSRNFLYAVDHKRASIRKIK